MQLTNPVYVTPRSRFWQLDFRPFFGFLLLMMFMLFAFSVWQGQQTAIETLPDGLELVEWEAIQAGIQRAEYQITYHDATDEIDAPYYWAPNRANGWLVNFTEDGATIQPNGLEIDGWEWGLKLAGYGVGDTQAEISAKPELTVDKYKATYAWSDNIEEWWVNGAEGLEHGFTVKERPIPSQNDTLFVEVQINSDLKPKQTNDLIEFYDAGQNKILTYEKLYVVDSTGKTLSSEMKVLSDGKIGYIIDDVDARYPIVIDPDVINELTRINPSDAKENDWFGYSVAIHGDTIAVLNIPAYDPVNSNVYIFDRENNTENQWQESQKIPVSYADSHFIDEQSRFIDLYEDSLVIFEVKNRGNYYGNIHVHYRNQGGENNWGKYKTVDSRTIWRSKYLVSLQVNDNTIAFGFNYTESDRNDEGLHIFERNFGGAHNWGEVDTEIGDYEDGLFGHSIGLYENLIVISELNSPYIYIYQRDDFGNWILVDRSKLSTGEITSINQNTVDVNGQTITVVSQGFLHVFERDLLGGSQWKEVKKISLDNPIEFGKIHGDIIALSVSIDGSTNSEIVILERHEGGFNNWGMINRLEASDGSGNCYSNGAFCNDDEFGDSFDISENLIVVGARFADPNGPNSGDAYIFGLEDSSNVIPTSTIAPTNEPTTEVVLYSPSCNQVISDTTPLFNWSQVINAENYQLLVMEANNPIPIVNTFASEQVQTEYQQGLMANSDYYWRVRPQNEAGVWGEWSENCFFEIDEDAPLPTATSISTTTPTNTTTPSPTATIPLTYGAAGDVTLYEPICNRTIADATPLFKWSAAENAVNYQFLLMESGNLIPVVNTFGRAQSSTQYQKSPMADGNYYWRVRAQNGAGVWGEWTSSCSFKVDEDAPQLDNYIYVPIVIR